MCTIQWNNIVENKKEPMYTYFLTVFCHVLHNKSKMCSNIIRQYSDT